MATWTSSTPDPYPAHQTPHVALGLPRIEFPKIENPLNEWGVGPTTNEAAAVSTGAPFRATGFVKDNADTIFEAAERYGIPALVLANVLYQEKMHNDPTDALQDWIPGVGSDPTLGPAQVRVSQFIRMVEANDSERTRVFLSDEQRAEFDRDPEGFARNYLTGETTGIHAAAAMIANNLHTLSEEKLIPTIEMYDDVNRMSLEQFVYGAAFYSIGGRSGSISGDNRGFSEEDKRFNHDGPEKYIDLSQNDISGFMGRDLRSETQLTNAFRYLNDAHQALYGDTRELPQALSGYFTGDDVVLSNPAANAPAPAPGPTPMQPDRIEPTGPTPSHDGPAPIGNQATQPVEVAPPPSIEEQARQVSVALGYSGPLAERLEERLIEWASGNEARRIGDVYTSPGFMVGSGRDNIGMIGEAFLDTGADGGDDPAARRALSDLREHLFASGGRFGDMARAYGEMMDPGSDSHQIFARWRDDAAQDMRIDALRTESVGHGVVFDNGQAYALDGTKRTGDAVFVSRDGERFAVEIREGHAKNGTVYNGWGTNERWYPFSVEENVTDAQNRIDLRAAGEVIVGHFRNGNASEDALVPYEEWRQRRIDEQRIGSVGNAVVFLGDDDPRRVVATVGEGVAVDIVRANGERVFIELRAAQIADRRMYIGFGTDEQWYPIPKEDANGRPIAVYDENGKLNLPVVREYIEAQARAGNINERAWVSENEWHDILRQRGREEPDPAPDKIRLDGHPNGWSRIQESTGESPQAVQERPPERTDTQASTGEREAAARTLSPVGAAVEVSEGIFYPVASIGNQLAVVTLEERDGYSLGAIVSSGTIQMPDGSARQYFGIGGEGDWQALPTGINYVGPDGRLDHAAAQKGALQLYEEGRINGDALIELRPILVPGSMSNPGHVPGSVDASRQTSQIEASPASAAKLPQLDESGHPAHQLFASALDRIREYERGRGIDSGDFARNLAGGLTVRSMEAGLPQINHVVFNTEGTRAFAIDTPNIDAEWRRVAYIDAAAGQQNLQGSSERARELSLASTPQHTMPQAMDQSRSMDEQRGTARSMA
jgi:hypothetical protein